MKRLFFLPLLFITLALAGKTIPECASSGGIAANFLDIDGKWKASETRVHIDETSDGLKFIFFTGVKKGEYTFKKAAKDSPAVVGQESVEIQISPDGKEYFHIGVNPAGDLYTARKRDTSWEPAGLKIDVKAWDRILIELPWAAMGQSKPSKGSVWRINFCHTRSNGRYLQHFSWGGGNDYHNVDLYGKIRFGVSNAPVVIIENQSTVEASARIIRGKDLRWEMEEDGRLWQGKISKVGKWEFFAPPTELALKSRHKRTFRLKDRKGRILWQRTGICGFDNRPYLELDRYYYTPGEKKLFWQSAFKGNKSFLLTGASTAKWNSAEEKGSIALPATPGRYLLTVQSRHHRFSRVFEVLETSPVMRDCSGAWKVQGNFLVCGSRKRFLYGGSQTKVLKLHHGPCFNLGHIKVGKLPGALELAQLPGKRLRRSPQGTGYVFQKDEKSVLEFFRAQGMKLNGQPLQISRISYEAQMKSWFEKNKKFIETDSGLLYKKIYTELKKTAPGQLFSLQIDKQPEALRFASSCDVFEIAVKGSYLADPMPDIAREIRNIRTTVLDKVLIHWFGVTVPNNFSRSAEELRAELYLAFINGSAGALLHLGHGFLPADRSRLWSVISSTGAELDGLMEEFHSGAPVDVKEPAGFQLALRDCGRYWLLAAVNCNYSSNRLKLTLPGKKFFSTAFAGLEARVFRIRK